MAIAKGSPPRVRGKVALKFESKGLARITPACAGKRPIRQTDCIARGDHPRVCGEKPMIAVVRLAKSGSPPRVRGKEYLHPRFHTTYRITPACAGKSRYPQLMGVWRKDHPRVCGEKPIIAPNINSTSGSPPRVRGKVEDWLDIIDTLRITPACAGKRRTPSHVRAA